MINDTWSWICYSVHTQICKFYTIPHDLSVTICLLLESTSIYCELFLPPLRKVVYVGGRFYLKPIRWHDNSFHTTYSKNSEPPNLYHQVTIELFIKYIFSHIIYIHIILFSVNIQQIFHWNYIFTELNSTQREPNLRVDMSKSPFLCVTIKILEYSKQNLINKSGSTCVKSFFALLLERGGIPKICMNQNILTWSTQQ